MPCQSVIRREFIEGNRSLRIPPCSFQRTLSLFWHILKIEIPLDLFTPFLDLRVDETRIGDLAKLALVMFTCIFVVARMRIF